jgi:signal transduction histidine kinase
MDFHKKRLFLLLFGFVFVFMTMMAIKYFSDQVKSPEFVLESFNQNLSFQSNLLDNVITEYENVLNDYQKDYWPLFEKIGNGDPYFVFVFTNSKLSYWNTSSVYLEDFPHQNDAFLVKSLESWYLGKYKKIGKYEILVLQSVLSDYGVENQFVKQGVLEEFSDCADVKVSDRKGDNSFLIDHLTGSEHYLEINSVHKARKKTDVLFVLVIFWYLLMSLIFFSITQKIFSRKNKKLLFYYFVSLALLLFIVFLDSKFFISKNLTQSELFNFMDNGSHFSIAGLLIGSLSIIVFLLFVYLDKESFYFPSQVKFKKIFLSVNYLLLIFIPICLLILASSLIKHSGFTESYLLFENFRSLIFSFLIILLGIILYFSMRLLVLNLANHKLWIPGILIVLIILVGICLFTSVVSWEVLIISVALAGVALLAELLLGEGKQFSVLFHLLYIIVLTIAFSIIINFQIEDNRDKDQHRVSAFLGLSGDKSIEDYWNSIFTKFKNDVKLNSLLNSSFQNDHQKLTNYLEDNYLKEISQGIDYQITICEEGDMLDLENESMIVNCREFFNNMKSTALKNLDNQMYLIDNEPDNIYYLTEFNLSSDLTLFLEFYSFYVPSGLGYAELLVDVKKNTPDLADYSFAKYHNNILISKFGEYEYHTTSGIFNSYQDSLCFELNNFIHYKLENENGDILLVSRPIERLSSQMITYSVLFILFTLSILLIAFVLHGRNVRQLFRLNLRVRLQLFFMIALSAILISTAIIIMYYTEKNSISILQDELNEKAHSVLIELQHKLNGHLTLQEVEKEELDKLLHKFSLVFFTDINIYDTEGRIVASSRPQIFEKGFLSEMVNPTAFEKIFVDDLLYYNCTEKIGDLEYFSSYLPLMLTASQPAGIINLPYFARQKEERRSFRFLLFTFINLFVILGVIGTIIAIFYSRLLTKPLTELQENIANIRIDMQNEKIVWNSDDEIGQLISEYNRMVDKLEASADILKRSEREIAWREVARQIAHEIKNPLTPMKLNIQYLEKSYNEGDIAFNNKLKDISKTLIEQIETLDKVAEMFSDMAKSNIRNFIEIDLLDIIYSIVKLFDNSHNIKFEVIAENKNSEFITKGVKKDITQIFNNLLKNSVEAIGNKENGQINIIVSSLGSYYSVELSDNGSGIPDNMKDMIFTPYFTTRSKGTGLGLAIVKTIIKDMGGNISIKSSTNKGTTFAIKFLKNI